MPIRNPFRRTGGPEPVEEAQRSASENGFKNTAVSGTTPLQIKDPIEYKLSEINDSGVYLPDISARSPIVDNVHETYPRQSLDARRSADTRRSFDVRRSRATPRSSMQQSRNSESHDQLPEEGFEEVGLNDEPKPQPKKRSIFSRFGDNSHTNEKAEDRPTSSHHFSLTGRKRAESGTGSELKPMTRPSSEVPVESR
ncbi:Family 51 glycoside hydrolase [Pyrenophora seminiperda CCB06]|uniref:Family 51 glycoside hydrolase n=1 Tax=Pyrenophora seminiperda CCB06 TaxID=1302712 RepID=A0A3M7M3A1_9PLEO|nr:Family 51 glycoside hydrolase [Pyrenophora seminiperda CCB06]